MPYPRAFLLRLSLTIASIPLVFALLCFLAGPDFSYFAITATVILAGAGWFLLVWIRTIEWNPLRVASAFLMIATLYGYLRFWVENMVSSRLETLVGSGGLVFLAAWICGNSRLWRVGSCDGLPTAIPTSHPKTRGVDMERTATACAGAVALVPLTWGVGGVVHELLWEWSSWSYGVREAVWIASFTVALAAGWALAWRGCVSWTAASLTTTVFLCLAVPALCVLTFVVGEMRYWAREVADWLVPLAAGSYMVITVYIWSRRRAPVIHGASGPLCPECGYNMTGLEQARCPECGTKYTIDELFAANIGAS